MSKALRIARRGFLVSSAAVLGGVAFGYYRYKTPSVNPLLEGVQDGEAALTPYVLITKEGITLITPRADSGQGVYSAQAALIAEELDVRLDQVTLSPGLPSPAYYNTALASEAVPFPPTDQGRLATGARGVVDAFMKFLGMQITGGSTSMPDSFDKLRRAGAVARETLKEAVAQDYGYQRSDLSTKDGAVLTPDGRRFPYTSLAVSAARIEPVQEVELKDPSEWALIGTPMQRSDIRAKSTGQQVYGIDVVFDNMLYGAVKLNPVQGGRLASFDDTDALAIGGVYKVVALRHGTAEGIGVLAKSTWHAMQAAQMVVCEWASSKDHEVPPMMDGHWDMLEQSFTPDHLDHCLRDDGDFENVSQGREMVEASYRMPYLAHAPLEPLNATVQINEDRVDVWTGTQVPRFVQANVAAITSVDEGQVFVHGQMMGGSFGHRLEDDVVRHAATLAMEAEGRPVKLTYQREEDMAQEYPRQISIAKLRGYAHERGVHGLAAKVAMPSVIASQMGRQGLPLPGPDQMITTGMWDQPYDIAHQKIEGYRAEGLAMTSSWRSVGASTNAFAYESFFDEICHSCGADPFEERLRLCKDDVSRWVLKQLKELSGWTGPSLGPNRGRGVAFCMSFGTPVAEVVEVTQTDVGLKIDQVYVVTDVGKVIDPINFENQVKGGVLWGLGHAMHAELTFNKGQVEQTNFDLFESLRMFEAPPVQVKALENSPRVHGIGEPPVPPAAPALANAIFAATGIRVREMPFSKTINFI